MKQLFILFACITLCSAQQLPSIARFFTGQVTGHVRGDDGSAISDAHIGVQLLTRHPKARLRQTDWTAVTDAAGSFQVEKLLDGNYRVCAQTSQSVWLNSCEWDVRSPGVLLSSSQSRASVDIILKRGAKIEIRIEDPAQLLISHEKNTPGAHLLLGVATETSSFSA